MMNEVLLTPPPFLKEWQKRKSSDLLLCLEWILLASGILTNFILPQLFKTMPLNPNGSSIQIFQVFSIILLGLMGLKRPKYSLSLKILYNIAEFSLVYLPGFLNSDFIFTSPPFHLIILIRNCSMFGNIGQLVAILFGNLLLFNSFFNQKVNLIDPKSIVDTTQFASIIFAAKLNATFAFVMISTLILLMANLLFFLQRGREELAAANDRLRKYALRIEDQAMLQERNRIAREMHDALGHTLTAQGLQLQTAQHFWNSHPEKAVQSLHESKRLNTQALKDVRQTISMLRSDPLQGLKLDGAIAQQIQTFHQTTGILPKCSLQFTVMPTVNVSLCIYRVIQEALTNIAKHSQASEVNIYLKTTPKQVNILIQDNGIGFAPSENQSGFGLQGMQERILVLDGLFSIVSERGLGCKIMTQLPLDELQ
jgi:signal transduction histidine kinase